MPMTWTLLHRHVSLKSADKEWHARDILPDLLNELIFRQRSFQSFNLIALTSENVYAALVYIFEEQDPDVLGIERLELLR